MALFTLPRGRLCRPFFAAWGAIPYTAPMVHLIVETQSDVIKEHFAVVRTTRRSRKRFPAACVTLAPGPGEAIAQAGLEPDAFPAVVYGPSKSSEGLFLYYLLRWLD